MFTLNIFVFILFINNNLFIYLFIKQYFGIYFIMRGIPKQYSSGPRDPNDNSLPTRLGVQ